ncbi:hypothetical protein FB566_0222 [Stackebrandtia endophytica]|uniref:Uncharacterized protein n=1 Tax=Stackebrandtia endophytica TaxID=1496996 RepID=A0A543AQB6_9ACTN|nr:hypothetical protein FB566_0222 [Stackebrandtia endophytica]
MAVTWRFIARSHWTNASNIAKTLGPRESLAADTLM